MTTDTASRPSTEARDAVPAKATSRKSARTATRSPESSRPTGRAGDAAALDEAADAYLACFKAFNLARARHVELESRHNEKDRETDWSVVEEAESWVEVAALEFERTKARCRFLESEYRLMDLLLDQGSHAIEENLDGENLDGEPVIYKSHRRGNHVFFFENGSIRVVVLGDGN